MSSLKRNWNEAATDKAISNFWRDAESVACEVRAWPAWKRGEAANEPEVQDEQSRASNDASDIRDLLGRVVAAVG